LKKRNLEMTLHTFWKVVTGERNILKTEDILFLMNSHVEKISPAIIRSIADSLFSRWLDLKYSVGPISEVTSASGMN